MKTMHEITGTKMQNCSINNDNTGQDENTCKHANCFGVLAWIELMLGFKY